MSSLSIEDQIVFAEKFFKRNPSATKLSRKDFPQLSSSFLKTPQALIRLSNKDEPERLHATGGYGTVKSSQNIKTKENTVIKVQRIFDEEAHDNAIREARINLDLNLATTDLIKVMVNPEDMQAKVYQEMKYLGKPIRGLISDATSLDQRLDLAIKLLIKVDELHSGKASKSGKKYAHRDIKPDNVLIDESGDLHLIDFGFSSENITQKNEDCLGTNGYLPIDKECYENGTIWEGASLSAIENQIIPTPNYLMDDKIASLRTIRNPIKSFEEASIFDEQSFNSLPCCIKKILDTSEINPHLALDRQNETEKFLAAALICYKENPNITEARISELKGNEIEQDKVIQQYKNNIAIETLDNTTANKLLSILETQLKNYQTYLKDEYNLSTVKESTNQTSNLAGRKFLATSEVLEIAQEKNISPQKVLIKMQEKLINHAPLLSQAQKPEEHEIWRKIKFFFSNLFGIVKGKTTVKALENSINETLANHAATRALQRHSIFSNHQADSTLTKAIRSEDINSTNEMEESPQMG